MSTRYDAYQQTFRLPNWHSTLNNFVEKVGDDIDSLLNNSYSLEQAVLNLGTFENYLIYCSATVAYDAPTSFIISGDQTGVLQSGILIHAYCGTEDGVRYSTISTSSFTGATTTVTLDDSILTSNLAYVFYVNENNLVRIGQNQPDIVYTPEAFGAVGDGVTDDTSAFVSALSLMTGGVLQLSAKTYLITPNQLNITSDNIKIKGNKIGSSGIASIIKSATGTGSLIKFSGTGALIGQNLFGELEDITIDGDDKNITGVELFGCSNVIIRNVKISNCLNRGMLLTQVQNSTFYNLSINNCGSSTTPAMKIYNGDIDGCNNLKFYAQDFETNYGTDIEINSTGVGGDNYKILFDGGRIERYQSDSGTYSNKAFYIYSSTSEKQNNEITIRSLGLNHYRYSGCYGIHFNSAGSIIIDDVNFHNSVKGGIGIRIEGTPISVTEIQKIINNRFNCTTDIEIDAGYPTDQVWTSNNNHAGSDETDYRISVNGVLTNDGPNYSVSDDSNAVSINGLSSNLAITVNSNTKLSITADEIVVREIDTNKYKTIRNVSKIIDISATGASGIDISGNRSNNLWYEVIVAYNRTADTSTALAHCYYTGGAYSPQYPTQSGTYVKSTSNYNTQYYPYFATDPSKSLIDTGANNCWLASTYTNQRFHIDLGSTKIVKKMCYENYHESGGYYTRGAKNFTLWGSNSSTAFNDIVYAHDTDWTQLTTNVSQFEAHTAANQADPKYVTVTNTTAYRYYAIKIADNWGYLDYMGLRRIELQILMDSSDTLVPTLPTDYTYWAKFGWVRTDASGNLMSTIQKGSKTQYTHTLPVVAKGVLGNITTPIYVASPITSVVPPNSKEIILSIFSYGAYVLVAPNNSYGAYNNLTNPPVLMITAYGTIIGNLLLESTNIYVATNSSSGAVFCLGWVD